MQLTKGAIGNLINRYKAVLKKCHLMNTFGSLAVAGMLVMGGAGVAGAEGSWTKPNGETAQWISGVVPNGTVLQGTYEGFSSEEETLAGVATVDYTTTGVSVANGTTFTSNSKTAGAAGALKLLNGIKIGDNVTFTGNKAISNAWGGGAIYIKLTNETHASANQFVTIGSNAKFVDNQAQTWGGAIALEYGNLTIDEGAIFEGNKTLGKNSSGEEGGGAIAVWHDPSNGDPGHTRLSVTKATFKQNSTNVSGGAIYNKDGNITIIGSQFDQNSSGSMGGAIANMSGRTDYIGEINITDSGFTENTAGNGGAVWNGTNGKVNITNSTFSKNTAMLENHTLQQGGAITNGGEMTITGSTFEDNTANKRGGAIYNAGKLTFNGTNTFSGNTAAEGKDIYNSGTLTMTSDSHLIVDGNQNIYNADSATLTVESGAKLTITDAVAGGNYEVVTGVGETTIHEGAWSGDNLQSSSDMVVLTPTDSNTFTAEGRDAHDVFTGLDDSMGDAVNSLYARHGAAGTNGWNYADVNAEERGIRFLSRATDKRFIGADHQAAAATIESAARIAFAGAVPQMTKMASDAGTNAVVNRLGFANPADGAQAMDAEGKIVDRNTTGFALWIAPLWQSQHGWGMEADNLDYGFNGNLGGVSLGADYTFENAIRAGITFNIGGGYAESSGGDLNSTENRMSFWGLGAYAGWNYENFGLMADVSYTSTWNDLEQDMDGRMGMGDLEADVQATAISAGLRAEYKLETSVLDIIPHIGVRYMSLNTWGYDVDTNGGTVLEGDGFHQDIWTFPIGVTFSKDFTLDSGWFFKPSVDFSVIPAAGDIKAKQDVAFTGLPGTYEVETQMMDYLTWQGGVGIQMGNDNLSFGVNYTLQAGQNTTGHGVFGSFRYEF